MENPFSKIWERNKDKLLRTRQEFIEKFGNFEKSKGKE